MTVSPRDADVIREAGRLTHDEVLIRGALVLWERQCQSEGRQLTLEDARAALEAHERMAARVHALEREVDQAAAKLDVAEAAALGWAAEADAELDALREKLRVSERDRKESDGRAAEANAQRLQQRGRAEAAEARVHALEKALERIWTTQVYEEPGKPAKGLNVEFVAAVRAARAVVLEGAARQEQTQDLGGSVPEPVVPQRDSEGAPT